MLQRGCNYTGLEAFVICQGLAGLIHLRDQYPCRPRLRVQEGSRAAPCPQSGNRSKATRARFSPAHPPHDETRAVNANKGHLDLKGSPALQEVRGQGCLVSLTAAIPGPSFAPKSQRGKGAKVSPFQTGVTLGRWPSLVESASPSLVALPWKTSGQQWGKGMEEDSRHKG